MAEWEGDAESRFQAAMARWLETMADQAERQAQAPGPLLAFPAPFRPITDQVEIAKFARCLVNRLEPGAVTPDAVLGAVRVAAIMWEACGREAAAVVQRLEPSGPAPPAA